MRGKRLSIGLSAILAILTVTLFVVGTASAQQETVLYSFNNANNGPDGYTPKAGLVFDASGNLYGTTYYGGAYNYGTVFELTPLAGGGWIETVLHSFNRNGDGVNPRAGLIFDASGNLYGTTSGGGHHSNGTVFELTPITGGSWTETVLHSFNHNGTDGIRPYASLIFDASGNLYGTTFGGGTGANGTVFELTHAAGGKWTEKVLHNFESFSGDGAAPEAGLIFDASGNLYGTTSQGGAYRQGTVFELTPGIGGAWTEQLLYSFNGSKRYVGPYGGLILDASGNLYGTTYQVGAYLAGSVFELTPSAGGGWTETSLISFGNGMDGAYPEAGLILDAAGNLYGTTYLDDLNGGDGIVFKLTPTSGGSWTETVVYAFNGSTDGTGPEAGLIFDAAGNLYGTTFSGGAYGAGGTVFEITP